MSFLNFLGGSIEAAPLEKKRATPAKKERNPVTAEIRVYKNGSVFPSASLVEKFELEYTEQNSNLPGFGFDVVDGRNWANLKGARPALFISPARRDLGKVDLFAQCTYENGQPTCSVMEQGAKTFGVKLLEMIKEVYGVEPNEEGFVDMLVIEDAALQQSLNAATKGVFHFPKVITRGEKAGQATYVRRENASIYGFIPASLMQSSTNAANISTNEATDGDTIKDALIAA